jgi:predicted GNAT family acetyltransferase
MGAKINIRDNKELMRFETGEGDNTAYLEYRFYKRINIALMHTVVPDHMRGQGFASALAAYGFQYARDNKKLVMVYCPFVGAYLKRHPEEKELLNKEFLQ